MNYDEALLQANK